MLGQPTVPRGCAKIDSWHRAGFWFGGAMTKRSIQFR